MRNIKLVVEYDGTTYHGWQKQPNGLTIQEILENIINEITRERINIIGSGRTDAGVHAFAQVANFKTKSDIPSTKLALAINALLPNEISVIHAEDADENFHAQYDVARKTYIYKILNRRCRTSLDYNRVWFIPENLNIEEMNKAALNLIGSHDFKVFSKSGSSVKTTVREVYEARFTKVGVDRIQFNITSSGFLKGMARMIVGTLVNVGKERLSSDDFKTILYSGEKNKFVKSAPPHGLYLANVEYGS